jgi:translation initiation factor eIF-2B subunit delta
MMDECERALQAIREDNTSGASELVHKAVQCVVLFSETSGNPSPSGFQRDFLAFLQKLIASQPAMAPFLNLANVVLMNIEHVGNVDSMKEAIGEAAHAFLRGLREIPRRIAIHASRILADKGRILTHSYSSTVFEALRLASSRRRSVKVICTESRPALEGVKLAKKLAAEGMEVQLAIDSAAPFLLGEVDLLLTGGDALSPHGLVNKVGTYGLAVAARTHNIPFYALCGTDKILTGELGQRLRIEPKDPAEVLAMPHPGVEVINRYFDITSVAFLSGVITEEGIWGEDELHRFIGSLRVCKALGKGWI